MSWWQRADKGILERARRTKTEVQVELAHGQPDTTGVPNILASWNSMWKHRLAIAAGVDVGLWAKKQKIQPPEERTFTMGQHGGSKWVRGLARMVG
eukprot:837768-Amphidinium_carterae.1